MSSVRIFEISAKVNGIPYSRYLRCPNTKSAREMWEQLRWQLVATGNRATACKITEVFMTEYDICLMVDFEPKHYFIECSSEAQAWLKATELCRNYAALDKGASVFEIKKMEKV